ncbi:MAG: 16S rRNA (adenine(1518)-N(6)/adenine(1519)-N(6))-dimethyltransferase RsmA [Bacteroidales bacterium]|jgi:16S rRNA (adenine1518-N6/adenine1519-N6)-dimethyltransferase|nr:16S rRNA (adenine(1518)-N(6)/adenine(1519)-N(6))-dimethyltransferase RsmA [Bacteroidales bacterium]
MINPVKAKKKLGQHFLTDRDTALKIVSSLSGDVCSVMEIGAGMGILTQFLLQIPNIDLCVVEIDSESVEYLLGRYPVLEGTVIEKDFLKLDLSAVFRDKFAVIGNFPYNISSQILFKILEYKNYIPEVVGMFQKEVAIRIASQPGKKDYGILSVLLQAFYNIEYLFSVDPQVFYPVPKVKSAVIRLRRNAVIDLGCNEIMFKRLVKIAFNQRRKMLRNSLKSVSFIDGFMQEPIFDKRPEQLSVSEFIFLTKGMTR